MRSIHEELERFDPAVPIAEARTPPASWYVEPSFLEREQRTVFRRTWQAVGRVEQVGRRGDYISGVLAGEPWVVVHDGDGLRGFFNVCRHHASCIVAGEGRLDRFVCPYHGWSYDLDGRLREAPRLGSVGGFDRAKFGLVPIEVGTWGPFVFVRLDPGGPALDAWLRPLVGRFEHASLRFVKQVRYDLACNWKVFVDNYLDGGYHVSHLHRGLASQLDLDSYRTELDDPVSLQICDAGAGAKGEGGVDFSERIGTGAVYAFVYPNFMINRYGPIMDTNLVVPIGHERTLVVFDYYFEPDSIDGDADFVKRSLAASDRVQREDVGICESVQRGLGSSAFDRGPYAVPLEQAAHRFHCLLARDLRSEQK